MVALCLSTMTAFADAPPVESSTATPVPVAPPPDRPLSDVDKLKEQIQKLENKLTKMEEENDIRRRLETTEEEKTSSDEAILTAAGRDYTLMKPGSLGFEYSIRYTGDSFDSIQSNGTTFSDYKHNTYHSVTNAFNIEFPVKDNLTLSGNIPFIYKLNSQTSSKAKDVSDLGDVSFGFQLQPIKSGGDLPSIIVSGTLTCPTGRSPYKIDSSTEVSTGSGTYSIGVGCNMSKSIDPLVAFGGINVDHGLETTHLNYRSSPSSEIFLAGVEPGDVYTFSMGIGYSLSYKTNLTLSYQFSYQSKTRYDWNGPKSVDSSSEGSISSVFSVGTGWTITPKNSVNVRLGIGLTNNDPDFSLMVRVPLSYEL